jgi:hypothetical protein
MLKLPVASFQLPAFYSMLAFKKLVAVSWQLEAN